LADPISEFATLFAEARAREPFDATACALATCSPDGRPSVRIVLLKSVDPRGFAFFTNYESRKADELTANPQAALCFHWPTVGVQVRVEGRATRVSPEESEEYFASRPRESQIGAWTSQQSRPIGTRDELVARFRELEARFAGQPVPRPSHWGGFRLDPERIELWWNRDHRLHDRLAYTRSGADWTSQRLQP
jgi:pyridoxamine 5'-phosphate oxidase